MSEKKTASLEELLAIEAVEQTEIVKIGGLNVKIKSIIEGPIIAGLIEAATKRIGFADVKGKTVMVSQLTALPFEFLAFATVAPKLSFENILEISQQTGLDCLIAGKRAMELAGITEEAVTEAKND